MKLVRLTAGSEDETLDGVFLVSDKEFKILKQLDGKTMHLVGADGTDIDFVYDDLQVLSHDKAEINLFKKWFPDLSIGFDWKWELLEAIEERYGNAGAANYDPDGDVEAEIKEHQITGTLADAYKEGWKNREDITKETKGFGGDTNEAS